MNKRIYIKPKFVEMDALYSESLLQSSRDSDPEFKPVDGGEEGDADIKEFDDDWEEWE